MGKGSFKSPHFFFQTSTLLYQDYKIRDIIMLVLSKVKKGIQDKKDKKKDFVRFKTIKNAEKGSNEEERVDKRGSVW